MHIVETVSCVCLLIGTQRERSAVLEAGESGEKTVSRKPVTHFQAWRFGKLLLNSYLLFIVQGMTAKFQ